MQLCSEKAARSEGRDSTALVSRSKPSPPSFLGRLSPERAKLRGGHPSCADELELERGGRAERTDLGPPSCARSRKSARLAAQLDSGPSPRQDWSEKSATSRAGRLVNTGVTIWGEEGNPLASVHRRAGGVLFAWGSTGTAARGSTQVRVSRRAPRKSRSGLDRGQFFPNNQPAACTSRSLQSNGRSAILQRFVASSHWYSSRPCSGDAGGPGEPVQGLRALRYASQRTARCYI